MSKNNGRKTFAQIVSDLNQDSAKLAHLGDLRPNPDTNYPLFSFKYINDKTHKDCSDGRFFIKFIARLNKLSSLGWREIEKSDRHSFGTEKVKISDVHHDVELPDIFKRHTHLTVFRATGDNHVFAGLREANTFHIFFIESAFGELYDHD